jgi:hypothetical protein
MRGAFVLALACAASGCGTRYLYQPSEHATAFMADTGLPAALYQVPTGNPQGEVKIASLGVRSTDHPPGRFLVLRMVVSNNSDSAWFLDAGAQHVRLADGITRPPTVIYTDEPGAGPQTPIPPRAQRSFDLLFAIGESKEAKHFELAWSVVTPGTRVSERTSFRREEIMPAYAYYGYPYGYWGYYDYQFYNPFFFYPSGFGFGLGPTVLVGPRVAGPTVPVRPH